jgi:hypothetical protein
MYGIFFQGAKTTESGEAEAFSKKVSGKEY